MLVSIFPQCSNQDNSGSPLKGYCDLWGNWTPGYITNQTWMMSMPEYTYGKATYYAPGAMEATMEYRALDYEDCIDGITLMSPIDIGRKAWVRIEDEWHGPFCVVDCARKGDMYSVAVYRETVMEFSFNYAEKLGLASYNEHSERFYTPHEWFINVEVWLPPIDYQSKLPETEGEPIYYPDWFLENMEFATRYEPGIIDMGNYTWKTYGQDTFWRRYYRDYPLTPIKDILGKWIR